MRVQLPSGVSANVSEDVSPKTLEALDEALRCAAKHIECGSAGLEAQPLATEREGLKASKPKRIQRKRVKGWRMPKRVVYVGRPTKYGNPFGADLDRYRRWVELWLREWSEALADLRGKDLACWCPLDQPCHADILLELANQ